MGLVFFFVCWHLDDDDDDNNDVRITKQFIKPEQTGLTMFLEASHLGKGVLVHPR